MSDHELSPTLSRPLTVLITGASGFLGRHVTNLLLATGHQVVAIGRGPAPVSAPAFTYLQSDLVNLTGQSIHWAGIDVVLHLAAAGVKASRRNWNEAVQTNIVGSLHFLGLVHDFASRRPTVFLAGTYYERFVQTDPACSENPYATTKAAFSRLAGMWADQYEGPVILGSIFQVYGPGDDPGSVLTYAAKCFKTGEAAVFGRGAGRHDWIYVSDVAEAVLRALQHHEKGCVHWDIGTGKLTTLKDMIHILADITGTSPAKITFDPSHDRPVQMEPVAASRPPPGWRPGVNIHDGLRALLASI